MKPRPMAYWSPGKRFTAQPFAVDKPLAETGSPSHFGGMTLVWHYEITDRRDGKRLGFRTTKDEAVKLIRATIKAGAVDDPEA